jgi:hypothetical protein
VKPVEPEIAESESRPEPRQFVALLVITTTTALALGLALKLPTQLGANDISRWCTVWSLVERGTYAIDDCPWQSRTQDKVSWPAPFQKVEPGKQPVEHFYSSKPPLLPTIIAGMIYPFRRATGVPLDRVVKQERSERWVEKPVEGAPEKVDHVLEKPKEPVEWPVHIFYLKPVVILLNVVPLWVMLVLYARLLDRVAGNDWAWFLGLFSAALGTLLFPFDSTLNNHTIAAWSAFFAIYPFLRIWDDGVRSPGYFAAAGFFGAFCACNELPAALFGILLFLLLLVRFPRQTVFGFIPGAAVPCLAFLATQYLEFGRFRPIYEEFGTKTYEYYGSYWTTPLEMDYFNKAPEPYGVYLFHMTLGHHGVFSLTPIFVFSLIGALRLAFGSRHGGRMRALAWVTLLLTVALFAFYTWNPKARNYGGSTQGLRWLFWLIPFWLATLPPGVEGGQGRRWLRGLTLLALAVSVMSVGYALRSPWSHPWILDALEHLNLYTVKR